jgi:hypothetical protein
MAWVTRQLTQHNIQALMARLPAQIELQRYAASLPGDATVFYGRCSPSTGHMMTAWFQKNGLKTPSPTLKNVEIWFGNLSSLKRAGDGYVVARDHELNGIIDYFSQVKPSEIVNPEADARFDLVRSIPINEMSGFSVYEVSLTVELRHAKGGIDVIEASHG